MSDQKRGKSKGSEPKRNERDLKNSRHRTGRSEANRVVNKGHGDRRQKRPEKRDVKDKERHRKQKENLKRIEKIRCGNCGRIVEVRFILPESGARANGKRERRGHVHVEPRRVRWWDGFRRSQIPARGRDNLAIVQK